MTWPGAGHPPTRRTPTMSSRWVFIGPVLLAVFAAAVLMVVGLEPWIASAVCVVLSVGSFWCGFVGGYVVGRARDRAGARESERHPAGRRMADPGAESVSHVANWDRVTRELSLAVGIDSEAFPSIREARAIESRRQAQADGWLRHIDDSGFTICGKQVAKSPLGVVHCLRDFGHHGSCLP